MRERRAEAVGIPWCPFGLRADEGAPDHDPTGFQVEVGPAKPKDLAPDRVLLVDALPHARSQKIVRRAVRGAALGLDPGDVSSTENLDALTSIASASRPGRLP